MGASPSLPSLLVQCDYVIARSLEGLYEVPEVLSVQMMKGVITTLISVGYNNPQLRREPLVSRIQATLPSLKSPLPRSIGSNLLALLTVNGYRPTQVMIGPA